MSYKFWKSKEYAIEKKFQKYFPLCERIPLSRDVLSNTKEDVIVPELNLMVDVQSTIGKKQIVFKREKIEGIIEDAESKGKVGCVIFSFKSDRNNYMVVKLEDLFKLLKLKKEK